MALQARAEATRRRIIDAAVELFSQLGYGETGLADVLELAGVSKGAFYYHFDSKESVAAAIIADFDRRLSAVIDDEFDAAAPSLAGVIAATFTVQHLMHTDKSVRTGQLLSQALSQISTAGSRLYTGWTAKFADMIGKVTGIGELRDDVDPLDVAEAIWTGVLGCHLVSAALRDDPFTRLSRSWRVLLRSVAPQEALPALEESLSGVLARYTG